jgi:hypothetical protein
LGGCSFWGIHRLPTVLPHSTELELGKLYQTQEDSGRGFALKLLRGLLTSREPNLEALWRLNSQFFTLSVRRSRAVFIGG